MEEVCKKVDRCLSNIQSVLNLSFLTTSQFKTNKCLGKVGVGGFVVGFLFGCSFSTLLLTLLLHVTGIYTSSFLSTVIQWNLYCTLFFLFHFLEFFITAVYQPFNLSYESYLLNHSKTYTLAFFISLMEFWLESLFFIKWKLRFVILGFILVVGGQLIRTLAMSTCGENFSHLIMHSRDRNDGEMHQLITHGVYSLLRHPSYFGWFYWSIGTQVLLCNPISFVLYCYASWKFFHDRIPYEEEILLQCYGDEYRAYVAKTIIGIPFVQGLKSDKAAPYDNKKAD